MLVFVGSISTVFSGPVFVPPRENFQGDDRGLIFLKKCLEIEPMVFVDGGKPENLEMLKMFWL